MKAGKSKSMVSMITSNIFAFPLETQWCNKLLCVCVDVREREGKRKREETIIRLNEAKLLKSLIIKTIAGRFLPWRKTFHVSATFSRGGKEQSTSTLLLCLRKSCTILDFSCPSPILLYLTLEIIALLSLFWLHSYDLLKLHTWLNCFLIII